MLMTALLQSDQGVDYQILQEGGRGGCKKHKKGVIMSDRIPPSIYQWDIMKREVYT